MNSITGMTPEQVDVFCEHMRVSLKQHLQNGLTVFVRSKLETEDVLGFNLMPIDKLVTGQSWVIRVGGPAEKPAIREHLASHPHPPGPIGRLARAEFDEQDVRPDVKIA